MSDDINEVPIDLERVLAAVLKNLDGVSVSIEDLLADYSEYQIAITQENDDEIIIKLVEAQDVP